MTEQTDTPVLRFKSFNDKWSSSTIGALGDFYYGKSAPKWSITEDVGIPCIRYGELYTKFNNVVKEIYSYTSMPKEKLRFSKGGEILIPRVGEDPLDFAKCVYLPQKDVAIGEMISVYNTKENPLFLTYYFNTKMKYEFAKRVEGASVSNLYYSYLEDIKLKIPDIREQEKLGEFFSKLDQQIELEEKKLELLEQQKKGYMQKIFSQELRFKDDNGNDYPNWAVVKLKDILSERKEYASKTENYPHATLSTSGITLKSDRYNRDFLVKDKSKKYKVTIMNDICYNPANLKFGVITRNRIGSVIFSPIYITFEVNNGYSPLFIELLVTRNDFINRVRKYEEGTVYERMAVKPEDFLNYETEIPCLEEQKKIGDFLVKIDKLIENQSKKIDCLKQRKQGLLQKMFV